MNDVTGSTDMAQFETMIAHYEETHGQEHRQRDRREENAKVLVMKERRHGERRLSTEERLTVMKANLQAWKRIKKIIIDTILTFYNKFEKLEYPCSMPTHTVYHLELHQTILDKASFTISPVHVRDIPRMQKAEHAEAHLTHHGMVLTFKVLLSAGAVEVEEDFQDNRTQFCMLFQEIDQESVEAIILGFLGVVFES